jgi:sigma-54-specific transcriptional regulator
VAATNIDLQRAVEAQHFRADLYWRLSVATLDLPPLRERPGDVLPLARHFVSVYGPRLGLTHVQFSDAAQAALQTYIWPGNVRELENVVHFGLIVCRGGVIEPEDLKLVHSRRTSGALAPAPVPAPAPVAVSAGNTALATPGRAGQDAADDLVAVIERLLTRGTDNLFDELEGTLVRCAFRFSHENQVRAARALGVTRNTMRTLLKRYGLLVDAADSELPQSLAG